VVLGGHVRTNSRGLSSGGHLRSRRDPRGHAIGTVRDCEAPGSNPGPPSKFVFKIGDSGGTREVADHSRVTDSAGTSQTGLRSIDSRRSITRSRAMDECADA
jgi:hypothetical protein